MKRLILLPFVLMLALLVSLPAGQAQASDYCDGYCTSDGYCYHASDGYWWRGGLAYTRFKQWYGYYDCYGCWHNSYYVWCYDAAPVVVNNYYDAPPAVSSADPNWRSGFVNIMAYRDRAELKLRAQAVEQAAFEQTLKATGLAGNFTIQGYGQSLTYPGNGLPSPFSANTNFGSYGVNGNTIYGNPYGITYNQVKDAYGDININQLYQASARLAQGAQQLSAQATTEHKELVSETEKGHARIAEILANAEAAVRVLQAVKPQAHTHTETSVTENGMDSSNAAIASAQQLASMDPAAVYGLWKTSAQNHCFTCHAGGKKEGGFDVTTFPSFKTLDRTKVLTRLTLPVGDPKHMPKGSPGHPGYKFTDGEIGIWAMVQPGGQSTTPVP